VEAWARVWERTVGHVCSAWKVNAMSVGGLRRKTYGDEGLHTLGVLHTTRYKIIPIPINIGNY
jgi:hypothetical protein